MAVTKVTPELRALHTILTDIFGEDCWDDSASSTANRILSYWKEYQPRERINFSFTTFPATTNLLVVVKDIEFSSLCAHHLLPFYGKCHVGYIPNKLMVGLSKIPRLVDYWAKRPSVQEELTDALCSDIKNRLEAHGVMVVIEARHTCMACRGVRKHNGAMVTSLAKGNLMSSDAARAEFLNLIGRDGV